MTRAYKRERGEDPYGRAERYVRTSSTGSDPQGDWGDGPVSPLGKETGERRDWGP